MTETVVPSQAAIFREIGERLGISTTPKKGEGATLDAIIYYLERTADMNNLTQALVWAILLEGKDLNLLSNPMTAGYEDYAILVLLLATSMRIWVNENKSKFTLPYRIEEGLEALVKNLGGS